MVDTVMIPAFKELAPKANQPYTDLWEKEIVKSKYEEWKLKGKSKNFTWWAKITPNLHLSVIIDNIEHATDLNEAGISDYASLALYQMSKSGFKIEKL